MDRIDRIKNRMFEKDFYKKKEWWGDGETIMTGGDIQNEPLVIRKALAIKHVANHMPVKVMPDELIVGIPTMASVGFGKCFPTYTTEEEDAEVLKRGFTTKSTFGHHLINYETYLAKGIGNMRSEIMRQMASKANDAPDRERDELYAAMLISMDAVCDLAKRYATLLIEESGNEPGMARRRELIEMARVCTRVPENPPETLHEALQSVYFISVMLHSTMELMPLGRVDKYLYPYYKKDIDEGRLTEDMAKDLIGSWLAKFSDRVNLQPDLWEQHQTDDDTQFNGVSEDFRSSLDNYDQDEDFNFGTSGNHWFINMILGGQMSDGSDATNDLTYIILEQWARLELVSPVMSVRFHKRTPLELYKVCADILRKGSGEPALYNDETIIPALMEMGIPAEDARGYSNDGCWEAIIPGKTDFGFCMIQLIQLLEYLMQEGQSLVRSKQEWQGLPDVSGYGSYDAFYAAFLHIIEDNARKEVETRLKHHWYRSDIAPSTLASAFMDDCVSRGVEYSKGGALYSIFAVMLCGFGNCVDSLASIRKIVYEDKVVSLNELSGILRDNYRNHERLRQRILNDVPKYGNDDDYADDIAKRLLDDYTAIIKKLQNEYEGKIILGQAVATFEFFAKWGWDVGASADGRFARAPVATNMTPNTAVNSAGPTALIKSATKPDLSGYGIGAMIDIKINANEASGEAGLGRLIGLIRSFFDLGGMMLTVTGVSDEELIAAQKSPMEYKHLRVRLGGLSAYFVALSKEVQDSIIGRESYRL